MDKKESIIDGHNKPVAYDVDGRLLYAHPSTNNEGSGKKIQNVHLVRSRDPIPEAISDAVRLKHQQSKKTFPELNLSEGEYVITCIKRHPIGLLVSTLLSCLLILITLFVYIKFDSFIKPLMSSGSINSSNLILPVFLLITLIFLINYVIYYVYNKNQLFLTNESLVQHIQHAVFSKKERVIGLMDIEDVSFTQKGIVQHIFNYGTIKLSTEGENATYGYSFAPNPKETVANLCNAIESFKHGRAIGKD